VVDVLCEDWLGPSMSQRLTAFARRFVSDRCEAEDIAQEALMRARDNLSALRSPSKAEAWLFRICRHAAIDHARARRVRRVVWAPMPDEGETWVTPLTPGPESLGLDEGPSDRLDLSALPAHQRLLVSLHYERGLSQPTLCRMTGLLPSALRVRLFRARGTLLSASEA
jgi:RNA polymerase sigma-70 factor (ECF subfamily)